MRNEFINVMIRILVVFGLLVITIGFFYGFSHVPKVLDKPSVDVRMEEDITREFTQTEQLQCNIGADLWWQVDAIRYHGEGYSVLLSDEDWKYSNTVENGKKIDSWNYKGDQKLEFHIISLGTMKEDEAIDWVTKHYKEYNLKLDEFDKLVGTTGNGQNVLNVRIRQFYETSAVAIFYPSDSPQEVEPMMRAMMNSFVFEGQRNRDKEFSYADLSEQEFWFASGAGGWATLLYVNEDGSFYGTYRDGDVGTTYLCEFEGQFSEPVKIDDDTWSTKIVSLRQKEETGKEELKDDTRYVYSAPYGLEHAEEICIYLPGTSTEKFTEDFMRGVNGPRWGPNLNLYTTNCYILHNVNEGHVFSSFPREDEIN